MAAKSKKTNKPKAKTKPKSPKARKIYRAVGRPPRPILTLPKVEAAIRRHVGNLNAVSRALRVDRSSIRDFIKRNPELNAVVDEASEVFVDLAEDALLKGVKRGHPYAVCFTLKTRGRHRGYIENPDRLPPLELLFQLLGPVLGAQLREMLIPSLPEVTSNEPATVPPPVGVPEPAPAADGVPVPVPDAPAGSVCPSLNGDGHVPGQGENHSP